MDLAEKEFLSILILEPKIGFDLLQIKPKYLASRLNQRIFEIALDLNKNNIYVDLAQVASKANSDDLINHIVDIVTLDNVPLVNTRQQYISAQKTILEKYKKRVIKGLSDKLSLGLIECDAYLNNMARINDVAIKDETAILDEEEILKNINVEATRIPLVNFPKTDDVLKLVQGDFLMVGASTGVGKSGLLLNFMNELMDKYQCIYFNMEMSKSTIYKRMISIRSRIPIYNIENPASEHQKEVIKETIKDITSKEVIVEHKASYLHEIKAVIGQHKDDRKHTIIFLDHIGLIKNYGQKSIYEQTTAVAKALRQFCLDYDCTIISACQLSRASYNAEELDLTMLKDSGELENSSSKVILLYKNKEQDSNNDQYVDDMVVEIVKNRDGRLGRMPFKYDKTKQIFKEKIVYGGPSE